MKRLTTDQERELQGALTDIHAILGDGWSGALLLRNGSTLRFIVDSDTPAAEVIVAHFGQPQEIRAKRRTG